MPGTTYTICYAGEAHTCMGPKDYCVESFGAERTISKDELMFGSVSHQKNDRTTTQWRHWDCCTDRIFANVGGVDNLEGLDDLEEDDKKLVRQKFKEIAEAGVKPTGRKGKSPAKRKKDTAAADDQDESEGPYDEEEEEKPKKKGGKKK